ncbi:MAG: von Willebrand factor type A domain-containing protein [Verrucomicrobia bacterium]|nr:von Willebrand factor type A domain-containing protein [Verrucomicrobiota bacterium]MDA1085392.1 von Willebrand factor type A domain-containing protein [Verrucomicrobiota bacterium]
MNCHDIEERITNYLLGDLDEAEALEVMHHIESCESCRAVAGEIEPTLDDLRAALAADTDAFGTLSKDQHAELRAIVYRGTIDNAEPAERNKIIQWIVEPHYILAKAAASVAILLVIGSLLLPARQSASKDSIVSERWRDFDRLVKGKKKYRVPMSGGAPTVLEMRIGEPESTPEAGENDLFAGVGYGAAGPDGAAEPRDQGSVVDAPEEVTARSFRNDLKHSDTLDDYSFWSKENSEKVELQAPDDRTADDGMEDVTFSLDSGVVVHEKRKDIDGRDDRRGSRGPGNVVENGLSGLNADDFEFVGIVVDGATVSGSRIIVADVSTLPGGGSGAGLDPSRDDEIAHRPAIQRESGRVHESRASQLREVHERDRKDDGLAQILDELVVEPQGEGEEEGSRRGRRKSAELSKALPEPTGDLSVAPLKNPAVELAPPPPAKSARKPVSPVESEVITHKWAANAPAQDEGRERVVVGKGGGQHFTRGERFTWEGGAQSVDGLEEAQTIPADGTPAGQVAASEIDEKPGGDQRGWFSGLFSRSPKVAAPTAPVMPPPVTAQQLPAASATQRAIQPETPPAATVTQRDAVNGRNQTGTDGQSSIVAGKSGSGDHAVERVGGVIRDDRIVTQSEDLNGNAAPGYSVDLYADGESAPQLEQSQESLAGDEGLRKGRSAGGVPILGDIPLLGRLFKNKEAHRTEELQVANQAGVTSADGELLTEEQILKEVDSFTTLTYEGAPNAAKATNALDASEVVQIDDVHQSSVIPNLPAPAEEPEPESEALVGPVYKATGVNPFYETTVQNTSTFGIDVDTAAYTLARRQMIAGNAPAAEAVRTEEFVNYFDYNYNPPASRTFGVDVEMAPSPFGHGLQMLKVGIKAKRVGREERRAATLTFVIDASGSMDTPDRLGLVKKSLLMLVQQLAPADRVAIVQYHNTARLVLDHTPASEKQKIIETITGLRTSGSTNLEDGLGTGYEVAARNFSAGGENRVLLLSDGVANLGSVEARDIVDQIVTYRKQGIRCSIYGFGVGSYNDVMLETLADKGDGMYAFVDSVEEAKRIFVDDLAATLNTVAGDTRIQVEFNPRLVERYRQLGYENRQMSKEQFRMDDDEEVKELSGEVGSGQSVTALYELALTEREEQVAGFRLQELADIQGEPLATVRVRYRNLKNNEMQEIERKIFARDISDRIADTTPRFRLAAGVAEFAEILRGSPYAAGSDFADVAHLLRPVSLELDLDHRVQELLYLVESAKGMPRSNTW